MIDLTGVTHHPAIEEIVAVLCKRTENTDRGFFRCEVAYFLGVMAGNMRATITMKGRGTIPVNIYAMALATSGYGKTHSVTIMETEFLAGFTRRLLEQTLPVKAEENFWVLANERALRSGLDPQEEFDKIQTEYRRGGAFAFTFDDGTDVAVKQLRHKLLIGNSGAISFQVDEVGSNLERSDAILNLFLELYDQGRTKQKLIKNTADNPRGEEIEGKVPTNMLLFGTPYKLLDGAKIEERFYSLLETGYARRCLFAQGHVAKKAWHTLSAEEIYDDSITPANEAMVTKWANWFHDLADPQRFGWTMVVERDVAIQLLKYKIACEQVAEGMKEFQAIQKAELEHRYSKALKLAGAYAFVDGSNEIEMEHLMSAILLVEESGEAFRKILSREKTHVRLGMYIAEIGTEVTQHDLVEALSFYPKGASQRNDMMALATAWGYKNSVIIKKKFVDGVEFFRGETLQKTDVDKIRVSYSESWAYDYLPEEVPFDQLHVLAQAPNQNWCNHHFKNMHRAKDNVFPGFNVLVFDVDGGISLDTVHELLKDIRFMTYTTKRHTPENNRFRVIIPTNYVLELEDDEYKEFYNDVLNWLPFKSASPDADVDASANQRSKKYLSHEGGLVHYNLDGELFDVLPFIPKTSKNEEFREGFKKVANLDNLERWFAQRMGAEGSGRNNQMIKFALALVDGGADLVTVNSQVLAFNAKLSAPLDEDEIANTIMRTVGKHFQKKAA